MTTTDLEVHTPQPAARALGGLPWLPDYITLAETIKGTELVPQSMRGKTDVIVAALLAGNELGIGPMQSLASINIINGRASISAELMRALISTAGHQIVIDATNEKAIAQCRRREWAEDEWRSVEFTMEDATRAGLSGPSWTKYPRAMLSARATSEAGRLYFADVLAGLSYTPEEVSSLPAVPQTPAELGAAFRAEVEDPDASTVHQRKFIGDLFKQAGIAEADERRSLVEQWIGRPTTSADMTRDEATTVIDKLEELVGAPKPGEEPFV